MCALRRLAEQSGIVVIDEIDKIVSDKRKYGGDASAEGVQRDLLPLIEGTQIDVKRFGPIRTDYVLFIARCVCVYVCLYVSVRDSIIVLQRRVSRSEAF